MEEPKNLRAEKSPIEIGDYVLATRWSDCDWNDPWAVGFVCWVGNCSVALDDGGGGEIHGVGSRRFPFARKISGETGSRIVGEYPGLEGTAFDPEVAAEIFCPKAAQ